MRVGWGKGILLSSRSVPGVQRSHLQDIQAWLGITSSWSLMRETVLACPNCLLTVKMNASYNLTWVNHIDYLLQDGMSKKGSSLAKLAGLAHLDTSLAWRTLCCFTGGGDLQVKCYAYVLQDKNWVRRR